MVRIALISIALQRQSVLGVRQTAELVVMGAEIAGGCFDPRLLWLLPLSGQLLWTLQQSTPENRVSMQLWLR
jgi:hypothetical protein